jgi:hypothetical protein
VTRTVAHLDKERIPSWFGRIGGVRPRFDGLHHGHVQPRPDVDGGAARLSHAASLAGMPRANDDGEHSLMARDAGPVSEMCLHGLFELRPRAPRTVVRSRVHVRLLEAGDTRTRHPREPSRGKSRKRGVHFKMMREGRNPGSRVQLPIVERGKSAKVTLRWRGRAPKGSISAFCEPGLRS